MKNVWSRDSLAHRVLYSYVREEEDGILLLDYLACYPRLNRDAWRSSVLRGEVTVNSEVRMPDTPLKKHDRIDCIADGPEPQANLSYRTVYEDDSLVVFDKPPNLCVHPTGPFFRHTLWYLGCERYGELHFVSRLDRETSGLLTAARTREVAALLTNGHTPFYKEYCALVQGHHTGSLRARGHLLQEPFPGGQRVFRMGETGEGELADTELFFLRFVGENTLVKAVLHTGRRHQIRATLFALGCPVVGDKLYGASPLLQRKIKTQSFSEEDCHLLQLPRQALHCSYLAFPHPVTLKPVVCRSACPFAGEDKKRPETDFSGYFEK